MLSEANPHFPEGPRTNLPFPTKTKARLGTFLATLTVVGIGAPFGIAYYHQKKAGIL